MTKLLIVTRPDDTHAAYAKLALNKMGYVADLWYTADFPSKTTHSFHISNNQFNWNKEYSCYDTVWYRRPAKPILPSFLHPDDIDNAKKENIAFFRSLWQVIFPDAKWINPINSSSKANSKLLQLKIASSVNLKIPETLISNDPAVIKNFLNNNNIIYKTLYPMVWTNNDRARLTYSDTITINDLPTDKLLQSTPGIFQEKIEKKHELRITYFGEKYIAAKINSQEHAKAKADWRYAPTHELSIEQVDLPEAVNDACKKLMQSLGIVFGCFDFIVTPNDEYYFLEVNEQGQFLWIEDICPSIKMLQAFLEFIVGSKIAAVSMRDIDKDVTHFIDLAVKNHINPPPY